MIPKVADEGSDWIEAIEILLKIKITVALGFSKVRQCKVLSGRTHLEWLGRFWEDLSDFKW